MKKIIKLEGLCCANCAAKIEEGVKKLDGVNSASLSFMTQRLIMEVEDGREDELVEAARAVAAKVEPEAEFKVLRWCRKGIFYDQEAEKNGGPSCGQCCFLYRRHDAGEKNILGVDPVCAFLSGSGV